MVHSDPAVTYSSALTVEAMEEAHLPTTTKRFSSVLILVQQKLSCGKSLDQIKEDHKLSETEKKILDALLSNKLIVTLNQLAEETGITFWTVRIAILTLMNKLEDKHRMAHLRERFLKMTQEELIDAVRRSGAKSKSELCSINYGLYSVANEFGVTREVFKPRRIATKPLRRLRRALKQRLKEQDISFLLSDLNDFEKAIVLRRALTKVPESSSVLAGEFNQKASSVRNIEVRLTAKFRGREKIDHGSDILRATISNLGDRTLSLIFSLCDEREKAILEECGISQSAASLASLSKYFSITRQRMNQIQDFLIYKINKFKKYGVWPKNEFKFVQLKKASNLH